MRSNAADGPPHAALSGPLLQWGRTAHRRTGAQRVTRLVSLLDCSTTTTARAAWGCTAGTFEERDWTAWAKDRLDALLQQQTSSSAVQVTKATVEKGHANAWVVRGKKKVGFDLEVSAESCGQRLVCAKWAKHGRLCAHALTRCCAHPRSAHCDVASAAHIVMGHHVGRQGGQGHRQVRAGRARASRDGVAALFQGTTAAAAHPPLTHHAAHCLRVPNAASDELDELEITGLEVTGGGHAGAGKQVLQALPDVVKLALEQLLEELKAK